MRAEEGWRSRGASGGEPDGERGPQRPRRPPAAALTDKPAASTLPRGRHDHGKGSQRPRGGVAKGAARRPPRPRRRAFRHSRPLNPPGQAAGGRQHGDGGQQDRQLRLAAHREGCRAPVRVVGEAAGCSE